MMKKTLFSIAIVSITITGLLNFTPQSRAEFANNDFQTAENGYFG
ncbi:MULTISPECIES: Phr family secreted Rap phosphatase inhibitor [Bacillus amyloliquefaciens group]|nr:MULTISPECIES: Phr family secreted Rap phosphatase inhibitor [Bacillus amyloliquefaciens group]